MLRWPRLTLPATRPKPIESTNAACRRSAPQALNIVASALDTPTIFSTDSCARPGGRSSLISVVVNASDDAASSSPRPLARSFDVSSFELVRAFVTRVVENNGSSGSQPLPPVDWRAVEAAVSDSTSLEQAIGRAVVIAALSRRIASDEAVLRVDEPVLRVDAPVLRVDESEPESSEPFFAFSMVDAVADFGDSRYRTRMANRVGRMFQRNRAETDPAGST